MFREADALPDGLSASRRAPYRGRLAELEALYRRHMQGEANTRPRPATRRGTPPVAPTSPNPFPADTAHWVVFEHAGGARPDLRALAGLAEALRRALMEAWTQANRTPAPAWISGHEADGAPARDPHLAVVPMANVGWQHSDGRLMGLALIPPAAETSAWTPSGPAAFERRRAFHRALARLGETGSEGRAILTLAPQGGGSWQWRLAPVTSGLRSLDPARYVRPSCLWASTTPVLLDRHLKSAAPPERSAEAEDMIRAACARLGLPDPAVVTLMKHAAVTGAPSARPAGGNPRWTGWARRNSFGARPLVHVRLVFDKAVTGPVLLGAGRFHGLGLFLPMRERRK
jgi:CRISPR-associated protein Csb2